MLKRKRVQQKTIDTTTKEKYIFTLDSYIVVDKKSIRIGYKINFDLYITNEDSFVYIFLDSGTTIDLKDIEKIEKIDQIFISKSAKEEYNHFLEDNIQNIVEDESLSIDEKSEIIYESTTELTHSLYENPNALKNAQLSKNIVDPILQTVLHNKNTISSYMKIIEHDYYTHTHSLNVSIYALCLGAKLNLSRDRLTALGRSALLHDLGKSKININILNNKGSLTDDEFSSMKMHPLYGYEIAKRLNIEDSDILDGIKHHHEKLNGRGYPDRLMDYEITLFPRIISICDVFDALTTKRSYKEAMDSYTALIIMKKEMGGDLDKSILDSFIKMLHS